MRRYPFGLALLALAAAMMTATCTSTTVTTTEPSPLKCEVSASAATGSVSASGGMATLSVTAAPECGWKAVANESWIAEVKPSAGQGSANVEVRVAPNEEVTPRQGSIQIGGAEVRITQEAAPCTFDVAPRSQTIGASGGAVNIAVTAKTGCSWSAASDVPWITVTSGATGSGAGAVAISVAATTTEARSGTVTIGTQTVTVNQTAPGCTVALSATSQSYTAAGGAGTPINVTGNCAWTATANVPWLTITAGSSGSGNGTVGFTVAANTGTSRSGTMTIAGQIVTIMQAAATGQCSFTLSSTSQNVPAAAGNGTAINVTTTSSCSWTATSGAAWITITNGAGRTGTGLVTFEFTANTGAQRTGTLTIAGQTVTVTQAAAATPCSYSINPIQQSVGSAAGQGSPISITTANTCTWTASSNASWLSIASGSSGTGNGTVGFAVTTNTGAERSGTLTVAGQMFTVTQAAAPSPCTYNLSSTSQSIGASGGAGSPISVTAAGGCTWTAVTSDGWISVTKGASGSGNGTVNFTVAANTGAARTGTITIAGMSFTVSQALSCSYQIAPTTASFGTNGGTGTVTVTAPASCSWTATSNDSWITVTAGSSGSGNGAVTYTVPIHTKDRTGRITIAGQTFTVVQSKN